MMSTNFLDSFESDLLFNDSGDEMISPRGLDMGLDAYSGMNLNGQGTANANLSLGSISLSSNSSQFEQLLQLHSAMERFKNYTLEAKSCQPDGGADAVDVYSMATTYKQFHGYIALLVCIFGAIANCLIMVVLRRKEMHTPVNIMLFALAIADLLIMIEYIPFALHMYMVGHDLEDKYTYASAAFVFFHVHFTQIIHTISIQLTLTMAIWRYAAIKSTTSSSPNSCTFKRCHQVVAAAYICPLFFCILNYLYFQIVRKTKYVTYGPAPFQEIDGSDHEKLHIFQTVCKFLHMHDCTIKKVELYIVESSDIVKEHPVLHTIHFWTFSVLIKLIPCVVLTFFMCWMVNTLYKARRHHKMLENKSALPLSPVTPAAAQPSTVSTTLPQNGECQQGTMSPSKGGGGGGAGGNTLIHPEGLKKVGNSTVSPSRSIRFAPSTNQDKHQSQDEGECPKTALLSAEHHQNHNGNGVIIGGSNLNMNLTLHPNPILVTSDSLNDQELDSRRASAGSGGHELNGGGVLSGARRFTKSFIRLPSLRRPSTDKGGGSKSIKGCKRTDRTSKMLIAVLVLFLLTEFPQGIMHFLTGWYGPEFLRCKYNPWAEVWDILALINSAINFIIYCFMSKQFRTQFQISFNLHFCFKKPKWITLSACNNNQNTVSTTV